MVACAGKKRCCVRGENRTISGQVPLLRRRGRGLLAARERVLGKVRKGFSGEKAFMSEGGPSSAYEAPSGSGNSLPRGDYQIDGKGASFRRRKITQ